MESDQCEASAMKMECQECGKVEEVMIMGQRSAIPMCIPCIKKMLEEQMARLDSYVKDPDWWKEKTE